MNFLKKGPELKLSELKKIKVPGFVEDVFYDLKDRHLLPVAAILLVAIFAVPIAISDSGSGEEAGSAAGEAGISSVAGGAEPTGALVAQSAPNLRKYQRRLEARSATNPFAKKFQQTQAASDGESSAGEGTSTTSTGSTESGEPSYSYVPSESGGGGRGDGNSTPGKLTHYSYAIDVRITGGSGNQKKSTVRRNLPALTMLPSRETPAIVYMGATRDGDKAVMTVSSDVQAIFGDGKCVLGSQTCQMLVMEPGLPETFIYGGAEKTYKIELLEITLVESDKVNKAALGEPKQGKDKGKTGNRSLAADSITATEKSR
jgi:hypothetical protein